jgi:DNA-binding CsgD family transcriptional regulator
LIGLYAPEEADPVIRQAAREITVAGLDEHAGGPAALRARLALRRGHTDDARAEAEQALRACGQAGDRSHAQLARSVLAVVALRGADPVGAARHLALCQAEGGPGERARPAAHLDWLAFLVATDAMEAGPALAVLGRDFAGLADRPSLYLEEASAAPWLVRLALEAGQPTLAAAVVARISEVAGRMPDTGPGAAMLRATAGYARALAGRDVDALGRVRRDQLDPWTAALAAEDHGAGLLRENAGRGAPSCAADSLQAALSAFTAMGAHREAARLRSTLRRIGIRRRPVGAATRAPDAAGWAALTDIERTVAHLVGRGLTNHQASRQVFLSPHTVNYHLRQIFRKLGVRSRVEIARAIPREF